MRLRTSFLLGGAAITSALIAVGPTACYPSAGEGVDPPALSFYYPVGFAVSNGGNVLYVVNSDFDLQWNGGTIQSLDLHSIRRDSVACIKDPTDPNLPLAQPADPGACPGGPPVSTTRYDGGVQPGWACAPPTNASFYMRDSVAIGAFATDLQLSNIQKPSTSAQPTNVYRLFTPVRGDASLTFVDVVNDDPNVAPLPTDTPETYAPFALDCGARESHNRCPTTYQVGNNAFQPGDSREITMPGEPFGMAQSDDGQAIVITHQSDILSSLFTTFTPIVGSIPPQSTQSPFVPSLQFVLSGVPTGGIGIASIPHDPQAYAECFNDPTIQTDACKAVFPRPAFLQTSRAAAQVAMIRYYSDQGDQATSVVRPFIQNEADYTLNVLAGTTDFARGIAIDPSPRIRCKATITVPPTDPTYQAQVTACAQLPARVFVASRGPASLLIGEVGEPATENGNYNADLAIFTDAIPLPNGPSAVRMAPVIDQNGNYALRVFIVCFDTNTIIDYDPDQKLIEAIIPVGLGPFALTFDPFNYEDAANGVHVNVDPRDQDIALKKYRFGYVGSFTNSYMQVIDLDNSTADKSTWATVVYTVGVPTPPKGS